MSNALGTSFPLRPILGVLHGGHLTQEEGEKEALAVRISKKFALLEEERHVIEKMAYNDKYKKLLDEIWKDKVELDGKTVKEEEDAVKRIKGEALKEKDNPGAFIFPIRVCYQTFRAARFDVLRIAESDCDDEEEYQVNSDVLNRMGVDREIDDMLRIRLHEAGSNEEIFTSVAWIKAFNINEPIYDYWLSISREEQLGLSRSHTSTIRNLLLWVINKMITYGWCQRTTGYDKIQMNDLWLLSMFDAKHQNGYADVAWDLYDMMEIRQEAIEHMEYRQSYHWDRYHGVFEHMAGVYSVLLQRAYNPLGYSEPQYDQYYQQYQPHPP
nr:hypothetical protein [Tanacetum cinerariifolium]